VSAYWLERGYKGVIASNTTTSVWLRSGAAFTSAPVAGHTVYIGRIPAEHKSKQFVVKPDARMRVLKLVVAFTPLAKARVLRVRSYEDGAEDAKDDWVANTTVEGVTFATGADYIDVDLSTETGVVEVPLQISWKRTVQFGFEVIAPVTPLELMSYELVGEYE
jgi:hypothetical protein